MPTRLMVRSIIRTGSLEPKIDGVPAHVEVEGMLEARCSRLVVLLGFGSGDIGHLWVWRSLMDARDLRVIESYAW